jgi:hypothetical protein
MASNGTAVIIGQIIEIKKAQSGALTGIIGMRKPLRWQQMGL